MKEEAPPYSIFLQKREVYVCGKIVIFADDDIFIQCSSSGSKKFKLYATVYFPRDVIRV